MSGFIRPEMRGRLARWAEPAFGIAAALYAARLLWRGYVLQDWILETLGILLLPVGLGVFWAGFRRALFSGAGGGRGVVEVDERQITYLSASGGGSVEMADMTRLEIRRSIKWGPVWVLKSRAAPTLFIPVEAAGSEKLFDALTALPGMDMSALIAARRSPPETRNVIWRAPERFRALT
ncbi:MAG: hypothetical protein Q9M41_07345 [Paracoccaceae bacterium]|nr:hypothetical protein [Paracoccaceae bacterium]